MADDKAAGAVAGTYLVETILKEISDVVSSIDDAQSVMDQVVRLTTMLLNVSNCSLMMLDPDGTGLHIRAAHGLSEEVMQSYKGRVGEGISGYCVKTAKPLLIENVETHPLFKRKSRRRYSTKSLLSVPLRHRDKCIGVLNVNNRNDGGVFTKSDELLLCVLANFVVIAIEKAQMREKVIEAERHEADLRVAREIQESLLPSELPSGRIWEFAPRNLPARAVAGDFFDAIPLSGNRMCVLIGDVCGKGVPAAMYMARVLGYFRVAAQTRNTAGQIMAFVNVLLAAEWTERTFVTAALGVFDDDTGDVSFCTAGHQQPFRLKEKSGEVELMTLNDGLPLGVDADAEFDSVEVNTEPGETFVLYTDGVTEAMNPAGDMFRANNLERIIRAHKGSASALADSIVAGVSEFAEGEPQSDDLTLLVIKRKGVAARKP